MKKILPLALIVFAACFQSFSVSAETRYISDTLYVPLRSGKGNEFRIVNRGLKSGTAVTVVEEDTDTGWILVETNDGEQGWLRNQYLLAEPIAAQQLTAATEKLSAARKNVATLQNQLKSSKDKNKQMALQLEQLEKNSQGASEELKKIKTISADAVDLHSRYQKIMEEHELLQIKVDSLTAQNEHLTQEKRHVEWIYGGSILLLGILVTLFLQWITKRRRYSDWA